MKMRKASLIITFALTLILSQFLPLEVTAVVVDVLVEPPYSLGMISVGSKALLEFSVDFSNATQSIAIIQVDYNDTDFSFQTFNVTLGGVDISDQFDLTLNQGTLILNCSSITPANGLLSIELMFEVKSVELVCAFEWKYTYVAYQEPPNPPVTRVGSGVTDVVVKQITYYSLLSITVEKPLNLTSATKKHNCTIKVEPVNISKTIRDTYEEGSTISIRAVEIIQLNDSIRLYFKGWLDNGNYSSDRTFQTVIYSPHDIVAVYNIKYPLYIKSEYLEANGGGWYDPGAEATISITSSEGFIIQHFFTRWSGDSNAKTTTAVVQMDGPKSVIAKSRTDFTKVFYIFDSLIIMSGSFLLIEFIKTRSARIAGKSRRRSGNIWVMFGIVLLVLVEVGGPAAIWGNYTIYRQTLKEQEIPDDAMDELKYVDIANPDWLISGLITYQQSPIWVRIPCTRISTLESLWFGREAYVKIENRSDVIQGDPDKTTHSWRPQIVSTGSIDTREIQPTFTTRIPITEADVHKWIQLDARMDICYPRRASAWAYEDVDTTVGAHFPLFVITPEEMQLKRDIWIYNNPPIPFFESIATILWVFLLGPLLWVGIKRDALGIEKNDEKIKIQENDSRL